MWKLLERLLQLVVLWWTLGKCKLPVTAPGQATSSGCWAALLSDRNNCHGKTRSKRVGAFSSGLVIWQSGCWEQRDGFFFPVISHTLIKKNCPGFSSIQWTKSSGLCLVVLILAKHPLTFIFQKFTWPLLLSWIFFVHWIWVIGGTASFAQTKSSRKTNNLSLSPLSTHFCLCEHI